MIFVVVVLSVYTIFVIVVLSVYTIANHQHVLLCQYRRSASHILFLFTHYCTDSNVYCMLYMLLCQIEDPPLMLALSFHLLMSLTTTDCNACCMLYVMYANLSMFRWVPSTLGCCCLKFALTQLYFLQEIWIDANTSNFARPLQSPDPTWTWTGQRSEGGKEVTCCLWICPEFFRKSLTTLTPLAWHLTARKTWQMNSSDNVPPEAVLWRCSYFTRTLDAPNFIFDWCRKHVGLVGMWMIFVTNQRTNAQTLLF